MTEETKTNEPKTPKKEGLKAKSKGSPSAVRGLIDGTLLTGKSFTGQLPFVLFMAVIAMLYISNRYHSERLRRKISTTKTELSELRAQSVFISAELMKLSRQTEVAREVAKKGLTIKESLEPPKKIVVSKFRRD